MPFLRRFEWAKAVNESGNSVLAGIGVDAFGNTYVAGHTWSATFPVRNAVQPTPAAPGTEDIYVAKLDPSGNLVYATYFGGTGADEARAMAVDGAGNVYVAGHTNSTDFPTTKDAFSTSVPARGQWGFNDSSFLFRLNPDGTVAWSTYFTSGETVLWALLPDEGGGVYLTGTSLGGLPVTPGAYQTQCNCSRTLVYKFFTDQPDLFLAKFAANGTKPVFATYLGTGFGSYISSYNVFSAALLARGTGDTLYLTSASEVFRMDAAGTALLGRIKLALTPTAITTGPGGVYVAGQPGQNFQATPGAAQSDSSSLPSLPNQSNIATSQAIIRVDPDLTQVQKATWFGSAYGSGVRSLAFANGRLFAGGITSPRGLQTVNPLAQAFGPEDTGYLAAISPDLSSLAFSGYFGDRRNFDVRGVSMSPSGSIVIGGMTFDPHVGPAAGDIWVNSLTITDPPALRIDAVLNEASLLGDAVSPGELLLIRGAGFSANSHILIGDHEAALLSVSATELIAKTPDQLPPDAASIQVTGHTSSNQVLVRTAAASPGLLSADRTGTNQGYILNGDGSLNTPANPAKAGDRITIFATGTGPLTFDHGYAVTASPVIVRVDGFYAPGVAAVMDTIPGFTGDLYRLTVYVPNPVDLAAANPYLKDFHFPPQVPIELEIAGAKSQLGLAISIAQ